MRVGISRIIIGAYTFICHNYQNVNDQIILIGFSRGAFTARCIADLIHHVGVLPPGELHRLHEFYKLWRNRWPAETPRPGYAARVTALAVWDTVASIGLPLTYHSLFRSFQHVHSTLSPSIDHAFQALALHEHRYHFRPMVFRSGEPVPDTRLRQCWFAGFHADAGGGNDKDALAHFSLVWMMSNLRHWVDFSPDALLPLSRPYPGTWTANHHHHHAGITCAFTSNVLPSSPPPELTVCFLQTGLVSLIP